MKPRSSVMLFIMLVIGVVATGLFNFKAVRDFLHGRDPNEHMTITLHFEASDGGVRHSVFSLLRGHWQSAIVVKNTFALNVMYPTREFVPNSETKGPNPRRVYILVGPGGGYTKGDAIKARIDKKELESSPLPRKVIRTEAGLYVLQRVTRAPGESEAEAEELIHYDQARNHWILTRWFGHLRRGEGVVKDQTARVYYHYRDALEPNPVVMHQWVMAFVESLQINPAERTGQ